MTKAHKSLLGVILIFLIGYALGYVTHLRPLVGPLGGILCGPIVATIGFKCNLFRD